MEGIAAILKLIDSFGLSYVMLAAMGYVIWQQAKQNRIRQEQTDKQLAELTAYVKNTLERISREAHERETVFASIIKWFRKTTGEYAAMKEESSHGTRLRPAVRQDDTPTDYFTPHDANHGG